MLLQKLKVDCICCPRRLSWYACLLTVVTVTMETQSCLAGYHGTICAPLAGSNCKSLVYFLSNEGAVKWAVLNDQLPWQRHCSWDLSADIMWPIAANCPGTAYPRTALNNQADRCVPCIRLPHDPFLSEPALTIWTWSQRPPPQLRITRTEP